MKLAMPTISPRMRGLSKKQQQEDPDEAAGVGDGTDARDDSSDGEDLTQGQAGTEQEDTNGCEEDGEGDDDGVGDDRKRGSADAPEP